MKVHIGPVDRRTSYCRQEPISRNQKTITVCCCRQPLILLSTGTHRTEISVLETSPCRQQACACRQAR
ncbi:hypothetical protein Taro_009254 [Colocasia esculenta]|uniref:Uncharacterized protein n=1 Tax=Colocasia esculenta TaxID=4460 RepID=A0A843U3H8_COLES|nr:hypothetical protein [Colocasia esculenta]